MPRRKNVQSTTYNEIGNLLKDRLFSSVENPSVFGYKPHEKQLDFHSSTHRGRLYIGGNRSGKTVGGVAEDVFRLTGKHPFQEVPKPPIRGRIVTVSYTEGIKQIIIPELKRWLPPSELKNGSWEDSWNANERLLTLENGSTCELMSYDQSLSKFAGTSRHFVHFDEEPPVDIFNECKVRLLDTGGPWTITMTPVEGMCVDEETELLSQRGWLRYNQISSDDVILTHQGWKQLNGLYINENYSGFVHTFGGLDAKATEGHKWMTNRGLITEKDIRPTDNIQVSVNHNPLNPDWWNEDFLEILGWAVGDGTLPKDSSTKVVIYQNEDRYSVHIEAMLDKMDAQWSMHSDGIRNRYIITGDTGRDIRRIIGENKVLKPEFLSLLTHEGLLALADGLTGSDGTVLNSGTKEITTIRRDHADMYEMIGVLLGYRVTTGHYGKSFKVRYWADERRPVGENKRHSWHTGTVWCPNTDAGTFIARRNGSIYLTGNTWVFDDIYNASNEDIHVVEIDVTENPYVSNEDIESTLAGLTNEEYKARKQGKFVQIGGLVFPAFDVDKHVIPELGLKKHLSIRGWTHYMSLDHGYNNPTAILWHAVSPEGNIVTYDEVYRNETLIQTFAQMVHNKNREQGRRKPDINVADPSITQRNGHTGDSIQLAYMREGVPFVLGNNDVDIGVEKMNAYLRQGKWVVTENCNNLIWEIQRLRWKIYETAQKRRDNNKREEIHKKNDHAPDSCRYFFSFMPHLYIPESAPKHTPNSKNMAVKEALAASNSPVGPHNTDPNLNNQKESKQATEWSVVDEHLGGIF